MSLNNTIAYYQWRSTTDPKMQFGIKEYIGKGK